MKANEQVLSKTATSGINPQTEDSVANTVKDSKQQRTVDVKRSQTGNSGYYQRSKQCLTN